MNLTYKKSGVDVDKGNKMVDIIKPLARSTFKQGVMNDIGSFGAFFNLNSFRYKNPVLVSGTDGVGTKLKIAFMLNKHSTVGIDLVAMCVNDIVTSGARPLFFLDYFASGKLSTRQATDVIKGIVEGCKIAGCSLIGGETAEMPGFYDKGEYDLSGFAVGAVEKNKIINGAGIVRGDVLIGLSSSGLHSNGYSLARKLFFDIEKYSPKKRIRQLGCTLGEELLRPTRIYVQSILNIMRSYKVKGIAHITGGGLTENLPRILQKKSNLRFVIEKNSWPVNSVFNLIKTLGTVSETEMYKTFNMGIGMVLTVSESDSQKIIKRLGRLGESAFIIGRLEQGRKGVEYV